MLPRSVCVEILGDQVRRVFGTRDILQPGRFSLDLVLMQNKTNVEVAQLAQVLQVGRF